MKNRVLLFAILAFLLILLPALILAWNMNAHEQTADPVPAAIALFGFGIVPNSIPAFLILLLTLWKKSYTLSDLFANRSVFFASASAVISVYAVHLWTLCDPVQFGLLVHAIAVPFFGVVAAFAGFVAGSFLKRV